MPKAGFQDIRQASDPGSTVSARSGMGGNCCRRWSEWGDSRRSQFHSLVKVVEREGLMKKKVSLQKATGGVLQQSIIRLNDLFESFETIVNIYPPRKTFQFFGLSF